MEGMGKLLISGSGKGHKTIFSWWIQYIIGGAVITMMCCFFANEYGINAGYKGVTMWGTTFGAREATKNEAYYFMMGLAVLLPVLLLVFGFLSQRLISNTAIEVYENGIKGTGSAGEWLQSLFSFSMSEFYLAYHQISSIDVVNGNKLLINSGNVKHTIYAMNSREIRDTIMAQKSKTSNNVPLRDGGGFRL